MSLNEIVHPIFKLFNPAAEIAPEYADLPAPGAVIATLNFRGTFAGWSLDSFGEAWATVASAFEQRHYHETQFVWQYVWNEAVQS